jgi:hypothetical protein
MTTVRDIVQGAFRVSGVIGVDEAMTGDQAAFGADAFNYMVSAWALEGGVPAYTDAVLDDTFPLPGSFREGTQYMLGTRLSRTYAFPPNFSEQEFMTRVRAYYMQIGDVAFDSGLSWPRAARF